MAAKSNTSQVGVRVAEHALTEAFFVTFGVIFLVGLILFGCFGWELGVYLGWFQRTLIAIESRRVVGWLDRSWWREGVQVKS